VPVSAATTESASRLCAEVSQRWQAVDPLLPAAAVPPPGCGAQLVVAAADGRLAAIGQCEHWYGTPDSLDLTWGAERRFQLAPRVAGPDIADPLDQLLTRWCAHVAEVPEAAELDTAAVVLWPSRDIDGVRVLLRHGFAPRGLVAARVTGGPATGSAATGAGVAAPVDGPADGDGRSAVRIRRAGLADIDAVVRLGLEVIRFDAHFGGVIERLGTTDALHREVRDVLAGAEPWTWLAERDGEPIGLLYSERPEVTGWIAPLVRAAPVGYLMLMVVLPDDRARGLGAKMVAHYHAAVEAAGAVVSLLHYEQTNPLSAPFWNQQGYRPLWTSWEARPARTIR
jgi:GNAT superfamily N-acetyltransferase